MSGQKYKAVHGGAEQGGSGGTGGNIIVDYSKRFYPDRVATELSKIYDDHTPLFQQRAIFVPGYWRTIMSRKDMRFRWPQYFDTCTRLCL